MNGYRLFGWQVNRGLHALPDFYRADQFYKKLERPDVLDRLLPAGSLREAFRQAAAAPPKTELHEVLPQQIAATPRVTILSPSAGVLVQGDSTAGDGPRSGARRPQIGARQGVCQRRRRHGARTTQREAT